MVAGSSRKPLLGHERPLVIFLASGTATLPIHGSMVVHIGDMNDCWLSTLDALTLLVGCDTARARESVTLCQSLVSGP